MLIVLSEVVTISENVSADSLPGEINAGSVGLTGMPTKNKDALPYFSSYMTFIMGEQIWKRKNVGRT